MYRIKNIIVNSYITIIFVISIFYSLLMGGGFYGFGTDFYSSYHMSNISYSEWHKDALGWRIATLTINNFHLGVYITSFFLSFSLGRLIHIFFKKKEIDSLFLFVILLIIFLHTWPVFQSTSNAMRQGLTMSFVYLSLCALSEKKMKRSFLYIIISYFLHSSGQLFLVYYLTIVFVSLISKFQLIIKFRFLIPIFYVVICLFMNYYLINIDKNFDVNVKSRIIGFDFSIHFFVINLFFILFCTYRLRDIFKDYLVSFTYISSCVAPVLFLNNLYWQFERLNMMVVILNILILGYFLKKQQAIFFWFFNSIILLFLTYFTGMFASFK